MLVDPTTVGDTEDRPKEMGPKGALVSWVMANVDAWRLHRDSNHAKEWEEYYRAWRARWAPEDKTRPSERSKIICPATMQAVDSTISEIEEAIFGREQWFDIDEDVKQSEDQEKVQEILKARDYLLEQAEKNKIPTNVSKVILMGSIWGTGIAKLTTTVKKQKKIGRDAGNQIQITSEEYVCVEVIPLEPTEFIPDPTTDDIEEMLGCAHETVVPLHKVRAMIKDGAYFEDVKIDGYSGGDMPQGPKLQEGTRAVSGRSVWLVEWHGKVPAKWLLPIIEDVPSEVLASLNEADEEDTLIEAIVTIGNKGTLLGAKRNPFYMEDRCILAYQHDTVPNYFWGRGVPEKASNSQRTLDATVRARIDAMGLVANPMIAGDVTRLPRGFNMACYPGKFWPTTGSPGEVLQPFQFGVINPELFSHAQDMERMVSTATGAIDPAGDHSANSQSATNTALNGAAFIKRAKRAMRNIDRSLLQQLVTKMMWRYMQFAPDKFPQNYDFRTRSAMGVMARELEQQQHLQLLSVVPNESKPFFAILKAIFDNSASTHKAAVLSAVDEMLNPPEPTPEEQQAAKEQQELQHRGAVAAVAELEARAEKAQAEAKRAMAMAQKALAEVETLSVRLSHEDERLELEHIDRAMEMRSTAALEQQNAQTDVANDLRAQNLAVTALKEGLSAQTILQHSDQLLASAKAKVTV